MTEVTALTLEAERLRTALHALAEREDLLRFAVEGARLGTWRWNLGDDTTHYSEHSARLFGLPAGQALDRALSFRMIHRDDRALVASAIEYALANRSDCEFEFRALWPDGSSHWLLSRGHASYGDDGRALHMDGVMWDIDARKRAEQELRRSEQRFHGLFDCMREGFVIADALFANDGTVHDWRVVDINPSGCAHLGMQRDSLVGRTLRECFPDLEELWFEVCARAHIGTGAVAYRGYYAALKRHFDATFYALGLTQMACVFTDITAAQRAEQDHQRVQAQFLRAQKMEAVAQLAGGVAHDFNNILTGVLGYAKLTLANKELGADSKVRGYVQEIVTGAERAADLVKKMQIFSRGPQAEDNAAIHTTRAEVDEIVKLLRVALPVTIAIEQDLEEIPPLPIAPADMHQLLINLAVNARDAIREVRDVGRLSVSLCAPRAMSATCSDCHADITGGFVELAVADDGCGIAADRVPMIFEPFYTSKEVGKGTGLGMSVVHGMMHDLGGHIIVDSAVGAGTTMRLLFPASADQA